MVDNLERNDYNKRIKEGGNNHGTDYKEYEDWLVVEHIPGLRPDSS